MNSRRLFCLSLCAFFLASCVSDTIDSRRTGQVIICHKGTKTLATSNADSFLHLEHGDSPGPCPEEEPDS
jgi:hypothetical protein